MHYPKDRIFQGMLILRKYVLAADIDFAAHDIIGVDVNDQVAIEAEDLAALDNLGWFLEDEHWSHYA